MSRIMHTDYFGGDYPDEKFVEGLPRLSDHVLKLLVDIINASTPVDYDRYYRMVPDDYKLKPGFEP